MVKCSCCKREGRNIRTCGKTTDHPCPKGGNCNPGPSIQNYALPSQAKAASLFSVELQPWHSLVDQLRRKLAETKEECFQMQGRINFLEQQLKSMTLNNTASAYIEEVKEEEENISVSTISSGKCFSGEKNPIHSHFSYDKTTDKSECNYCKRKLAGKYPKNLEKHLSKKHPEVYKVLLSSKTSEEYAQKNVSQSSSVASSYDEESIEQSFLKVEKKIAPIKKGTIEYESIFQAIALAFVANSLPYRLVEDTFVRNMFDTISGGRWKQSYPHWSELINEIEKITSRLKKNIASSIQASKLCSITVDLWSHSDYSSAFVGITCHFYNRIEENLKCALLACRKIEQPHTAEKIYEVFQEVLQEWQLEEHQILRIVVDSGSNVVKNLKECLMLLMAWRCSEGTSTATKIQPPQLLDINLDESFIEREDSEEDLEQHKENEESASIYFERKKRISCFAHNLMLAVKSVINVNEEIKNIKENALKLIATIRNRPKALELLQAQSSLTLLKPVRTRWIYWFYIFERLLSLKKPLMDICDRMTPKIIPGISPFEWEILEAVTQLLQPFAQAVAHLEGQHYVTVSEVYPMLYSLMSKLEKQKSCLYSGKFIIVIAHKLLSEINKRFDRVLNAKSDDFDAIYVLATLLDPRYALLLEGELLQSAENELKKIVATYTADQSESTSKHNEGCSNLNDENTDDLLAIARAKVKEHRRLESESNKQSAFESEFKMYLADAKISTADPLIYWKEKKVLLPLLYSIAVDVLAVPATSAPVERVFSKASLVLKRNRHNLSDKKMELEVFFKCNMDFF